MVEAALTSPPSPAIFPSSSRAWSGRNSVPEKPKADRAESTVVTAFASPRELAKVSMICRLERLMNLYAGKARTTVVVLWKPEVWPSSMAISP